ncbi:tRNA (adenine22-N1)-methyltransferase [Sporobacter termitidis DSM 10068]|uniref:tRNA (Adenine22-N1)-methyltransferase n=1 Tax=Sporobacter termitidis DSM 10068 TaxID=1123282 RepID=A0A1M5UG93_9FIRM|nr:class I SAM-dependent methyltransferase [Sporobacter termitidis]SHH61961.1 tRNA (adenine22-N1)-methyltransferase [Sporobacter termitidis DSM 10068]
MKQLKLSNRLGVIAAFIGAAGAVVDVGTDHGYLPVWLALSGKARRIAATDIRKGPLHRAVSSAEEYGVADRIEFFLTDGLSGLDPAFDTVVIAGMGGETIIRILQNAPWTLEARVKLVLQPQTKADELIAWLGENGRAVADASLAEDERRLYLIFTAGADGRGGAADPLEILLEKRDPLLPAYLTRLSNKTQRALEGLARSAGTSGGAPDTARRALERYKRIKEETDTWQK